MGLRPSGVIWKDQVWNVLQVPKNYKLQKGGTGDPVLLNGKVTSGFGRGSRQLGFATANLPPEPLEHMLAQLPKGVYFG